MEPSNTYNMPWLTGVDPNDLPNVLPNALSNNTLPSTLLSIPSSHESSPSYSHQQIPPQWVMQSTAPNFTQQAGQPEDEWDKLTHCLIEIPKKYKELKQRTNEHGENIKAVIRSMKATQGKHDERQQQLEEQEKRLLTLEGQVLQLQQQMQQMQLQGGQQQQQQRQKHAQKRLRSNGGRKI